MTIEDTASQPKRARKAAASPVSAAPGTAEGWTPLGRSDDLALQIRSPTIALLDRLYVYGGRDDIAITAVASDDGGLSWEHVEGQGGYLPVRYPATTLFDGSLWLVGGEDPTGMLAQTARSSDASAWSLEESVGRWGRRRGHRVIGFNGRLHLIGGARDETVFGDVWRFDPDPGGERGNWGMGPVAQIPPRVGHAVGVVGGLLLVMGGIDDQGEFQEVLASPDGVNWTARRVPWRARVHAAAVTLGDTLFLIGGQSRIGTHNDVWATKDGRLWTQVLWKAPFGGIAGHGATVVGDHIVVAGGAVDDQPNGRAFALKPPTPGWTRLPDDPGVSGLHLQNAGRLGRAYWAWAGQYPLVFRSDDARTWLPIVNNLPPWRSDLAGCVHHGKLFACGGREGGSPTRSFNDVYVSTDGADWTQVAGSRRFTPRGGHCMASFHEQLWVYGPTDAWWSEDEGVSWQQATPRAFPYAVDLATPVVFRDQLWALGGAYPDSYYCWSSPDGVTWTPHTPQWTARYSLGAVVVGDTLYVLRGVRPDQTTPPEVWATLDGLDWERVGADAPVPGLRGFGFVAVEQAIMVFGGIDVRHFSTAILRYLPPQLPPR